MCKQPFTGVFLGSQQWTRYGQTMNDVCDLHYVPRLKDRNIGNKKSSH
jgi:DNA-binding transcriptional regulator of glucitol operon